LCYRSLVTIRETIPVVDRIPYVLIALILLSLGLNIYQHSEYQALQAQKPYGARDQQVIDHSIDLYVAEQNSRSGLEMSREAMIRGRFPVVVTTSTARCVNLRAPEGAIGWMPFFCFNNDDNLISFGLI